MLRKQLGYLVLIVVALAIVASLAAWPGRAAKPKPGATQSAAASKQPGATPRAATNHPALRPPVNLSSGNARNQAVQQALTKRISIDLKNKTVKTAIDELSKLGGFQFDFDTTAVTNGEITPTAELQDHYLRNLTIRSALQQILAMHFDTPLTFIVEFTRVRVITRENADSRKITRCFSLQHLPRSTVDRALGNRSAWSPNFGGLCGVGYPFTPKPLLIRIVKAATSGVWQDDDPQAGGSITQTNGILTVRQTHAVQSRISELLHGLKLASTGELRSSSFEVRPVGYDHTGDAAARRAMETIFPVQFKDAALKSVLDDLRKKLGVTLVADPVAVAAGDINLDSSISLAAADLPAKTVLRLVLEQHSDVKLSYSLHNGVVSVMTLEKLASTQHAAVYDVRDLLTSGSAAPEKLLKTVQESTNGVWENDDPEIGGTLRAYPAAGAMIVRQTAEVHDQIRETLARLRARMKAMPKRAGAKIKPLPDNAFVTRFYPLMSMGRAAAVSAGITRFIAANSWNDKKSEAKMTVVESTLIVRQTVKVHRQIRAFLATLDNAERRAAQSGVGSGIGVCGIPLGILNGDGAQGFFSTPQSRPKQSTGKRTPGG